MRLDKYLAHCGLGTRKEVKELIKQKRVLVNEIIVKKDGVQIDPINDNVCVDGEVLEYREFVYIMLNKPSGYISATFDKVHPTVLDLISGYDHYDLFPAGRLDIDTEGLLLITNDGHLAHHILSPKKHVSKIYYAKIKGYVTENDIEAFKNGIELSDFKCMSANLKILSHFDNCSEVEVEIFEGKFHQIKRMFLALGHEVIYLKRIKMKNLILDEQLELGEYRELSKNELESLKSM